MNVPEYFVGIDIASLTFYAAVGQVRENGWEIIIKPKEFENNQDGFTQLIGHLNQNKVFPPEAVICMESTGVYNEALAYFLVVNGYNLAIEPPLDVKRAFHPIGHKSDPVDSKQISEYAYRFFDQLRPWRPRDEVIEQIKVLLTLREQCVTQSTGHKCAVNALQRKVVRTPMAEAIHQEAIKELSKHIKDIEKEIDRLINDDPSSHNLHTLFKSIPGIGSILGAYFLVSMHTAPDPYSYKSLAAYIGICPYEHSSGSSINGKATSRHFGPSAMRRLVYLASLSVCTHQPQFRIYYLRKVDGGKPKKVVINNVANKLLKIVCAVARTKTPYVRGYRSINPSLLIVNQPLTVS